MPLGDPECARQWAMDTLSGRAKGGQFEWGERNLARAFLNQDSMLHALKRALFVMESPAFDQKMMNGGGALDAVKAAIAKAEPRK